MSSPMAMPIQNDRLIYSLRLLPQPTVFPYSCSMALHRSERTSGPVARLHGTTGFR